MISICLTFFGFIFGSAFAAHGDGVEYNFKPSELVAGILKQDFASSKTLHSQHTSQLYRKIYIEDDKVLPEFSHHVSIERGEEAVCSGAIIDPGNFVVTAASCGVRDTDVVRVNSHKRFDRGITAGISCSKSHPKFNPLRDISSGGLHLLANDIAIIRLNRNFNNDIRPLRISPQSQYSYGNLTSYSQFSQHSRLTLMYTEVPIIPDCTEYGYELTPEMLCAGAFKTDFSYCSEDRGNPLSSNGFLIGIRSWGEVCSRAIIPSVYTSMNSPSTYKWIQSILASPSC